MMDFDASAATRCDGAEPVSPAERACDDLIARWRAGRRASIEELVGWHAIPGDDGEALLELIACEAALRSDAGDEPMAADYVGRFPDQAGPIKRYFELEQLIGGDGADGLAPGDESLARMTTVDASGGAATEPQEPGGDPAWPAPDGLIVEAELGRGGMGVVYLARQVGLRRTVALKWLTAGAAGDKPPARFLTEAEAIARIQHPNVVQVYSTGEHGGRPFLLMEYVPGGTLASRLDGTPVPMTRAAELLAEVAAGIAEVHRLGVVHRDLKPSNILMTADDVPKVADFGLAKLVDGDSELTREGALLGSPLYMAPEQADPGSAAIGPAADVHALGAIFYHLLTGRPPYRGVTMLQTLDLIRSSDPIPPSQLVTGLSRDAETIALTCLRKEPARRYASASALAADLRRLASGVPIAARRIGRAERSWRWARRNPLPAGLAAAVVVMVGTIVAGAAIIARRERSLRLDADAALRETSRLLAELRDARSVESTLRRAVASERENLARDPNNREARDSLDALYSRQAAILRRQGRKAEAVETNLLRRDLDAGSPERLYQAAMDLADCLPRPDRDREPGDLDPREAARVTDLAIDTLGRAILAGYRTKEYALAFTLGTNPSFRVLASSPAFRSLQSAPERADLHRGNGLMQAYKGHTQFVESLAVSPDGLRLLTASSDGTARLWEIASGRPALPPFEHPATLRGVAFSPDGRRAAVGCNDGLVYVWDLKDGSKVGTFSGHTAAVHGVGFTPDGRTLVSVSEDETVRLWDVASFRERARLNGHVGHVVELAISPDGRLVVSAGDDETVRVWDLAGARALHPPLRGHHGRVWGVAVTPDGRRAWSGGDDGALIEWELATGRRLRTLVGQWGSIRSIAVTPDGRRAVSGGPQNRCLVWDLESGRELFRYRGDVGDVTTVAVSRDGKLALTGSTDKTARAWDLSTEAALARDLSVLGRWDEALAAYTRAIPVAPSHAQLFQERSRLRWLMGRWPELVVEHQEYLRRFPGSPPGLLNSARVQLMAGDLAAYRRLGRSLTHRIHEAAEGSAPTSWELALVPLLVPESEVPIGDALDLAFRWDRASNDPVTGRLILGLAQYRAGQDRRAIANVLPVVVEHADWSSASTAWPLLAMAYHRIGNRDEAERWMAKVRKLRSERTPAFGSDPIAWSGPWAAVWDWIDFELLSRQAEATLRPSGPE